MSVQLYVGNLPYDVTEKDLMELFSAAGPPSRVRVPIDRETGKPRGFAFVEFSDPPQAQEAIRRFDKNLFKGRPLSVNEARPREEGTGPRAGEAPPRSGESRRNFGPDALPRNQRKPENRHSKKETRPSGLVRQAGRGRASGEAESDDLHEDLGLDDFACWAREDSGDGEKD